MALVSNQVFDALGSLPSDAKVFVRVGDDAYPVADVYKDEEGDIIVSTSVRTTLTKHEGPETPAVAESPQFEYFHDGDTGNLYYRRIRIGADSSTEEVFKERNSSVGWRNHGCHETRGYLERNWTRVQYSNLPDAAK